jgi:hypothetical protein
MGSAERLTNCKASDPADARCVQSVRLGGAEREMKQMTLAAAKGFEVHGRATRKAAFLLRMEGLVPWAEFSR